jgi:Ca2+/Na+ antiporter
MCLCVCQLHVCVCVCVQTPHLCISNNMATAMICPCARTHIHDTRQHMCAYVCMHDTYVCMYVCTYVRIYVSIYLSIYLYLYVYLYIYIYTRTHTQHTIIPRQCRRLYHEKGGRESLLWSPLTPAQELSTALHGSPVCVCVCVCVFCAFVCMR